MILVWLIVIPLAAGVLAWIAARWSGVAARWTSLGATALCFILSLVLWYRYGREGGLATTGTWLVEVDWSWIPALGIRFHLAVDGLSLLLVVLTFLLGLVSVLTSWREIREGVGFFHLNLMWILAGITGVFLAVDLFLFYFAWELMLVPMYLLIAVWGHERRTYAAVKFFIFTQACGLLMLISILALYFIHHAATGVYTFQYDELLGTVMAPGTAFLIMLGFFIGFAVKLPVFPLHPWLPDAHTEAPTAGSVILAGLLLKTGAYGLLRFVLPLFPEASQQFAPVAMVLAVIGIIYGAIMAFAQTDLKRLVAYTSVTHLGFVLLGIYVWTDLALQGAVISMIGHGIGTGSLFMLVGQLQERTHTRDMGRLGGLWATVPRMSGIAMFFAMGSMGLPGLAEFVGEFLVLLGTYRAGYVGLTIAAVVGVVLTTLYALRFIQGAYHGPNTHHWSIPDLGARELAIFVPMMAILLWIGLYPQPVIDTFDATMQNLRQYAVESVEAGNQPASGPIDASIAGAANGPVDGAADEAVGPAVNGAEDRAVNGSPQPMNR